jgi:hypothetical protein
MSSRISGGTENVNVNLVSVLWGKMERMRMHQVRHEYRLAYSIIEI